MSDPEKSYNPCKCKQKKIFKAQIRSKSPPVGTPKGHHKFSHRLQYDHSSRCQVPASAYLPLSILPRRNNYAFLAQDKVGVISARLGGNTSNKERQIDLVL